MGYDDASENGNGEPNGASKSVANIYLNPHDYQVDLLTEKLPSRLNFYAWGSKAGKTTSMVLRLIRLLWETEGKRYRWIAPFHRQSKIAENRIRRAFPAGYFKYKASERAIIGPQGSILTFHSGDRPDTIPGEDVDGAVLDEAARLKEEAYEATLSTTFATNGWIVAISTPTGRNWFYREYRLGEKRQANHFAKHFPTYVNPIFQTPEGRRNLEESRASLPVPVYEQLVEAKFIADTATIFPDLEPCASPHVPESLPEQGKIYVIAMDVGQIVDFNVSTVWDVLDGSLVDWVRYNGVAYPQIQYDTAQLSKRWNNAIVWVESNGPGLPIAQNLAIAGVPVGKGPGGNIGFSMTSGSKPALVHAWSLALRNQEPILPLRYPSPGQDPRRCWPELYAEHEEFEYAIGKTGHWSFSAAGSGHDDTVMSCLIGWYAVTKNTTIPKYWVPGTRRRGGRRDRIIANV